MLRDLKNTMTAEQRDKQILETLKRNQQRSKLAQNSKIEVYLFDTPRCRLYEKFKVDSVVRLCES